MQQSKLDILTASLEDNQAPSGPVFLGGTVNSKWRDEFIPKCSVNCFNPVVEQWSMETQQIEEQAKKDAIASLFVVTPKQSGLFAIAELTAAAIRQPEKTVVCFLDKDEDCEWDASQKASNQAIEKLVKEAGATVVNNLDDAASAISVAANGSVPEEHIDSIRDRD